MNLVKIKLLDNSTIQKIAAGEVIEKPASIVKELVENSIDAGSKNISIEIKNGGIDEILISDDGSGINPEDVELAFTRHATSKIEDFNDLYKIYSMGFRGEALASIIAAADVEIRTKTEQNNLGIKLVYNDSKIVSKSNVAMNTGTIITVKDLFKQIPVRKKFLKSSIAESNSINDLVSKLAIGNPSISIKYIRDSKIIFHTLTSDDYLTTISKVFGSGLAESLIEISGKTDEYVYTGYISDNAYYRGNRALQYIFVNNRYIEEKLISKHIEKLYRHLIPNGKFPAFQLFIQTKPENIDVNIHPNKQVIKFNKLEELLESIESTIKNNLIPRHLRQVKPTKEEIKVKKLFDNNSSDVYADLLTKYNPSAQIAKETDYEVKETIIEHDYHVDEELDVEELFIDTSEDKTSVTEISNAFEDEIIELVIEDQNNIPSEEITVIDELSNLSYKGSIYNTYLLFEDLKTNSLIIMDQHAAHERVLFEKLLKDSYNGNVDSQIMVEPLIIDMTSSDMEIIDSYSDEFTNFGFAIEPIGSNSVVIREVPVLLINTNYKRLFIDILDSIRNEKNANSDYILETIIKSSCKSAIKSGDKISNSEVEELVSKLLACENPLTCPHGRPTYIVFDRNHLEKEFLRIK